MKLSHMTLLTSISPKIKFILLFYLLLDIIAISIQLCVLFLYIKTFNLLVIILNCLLFMIYISISILSMLKSIKIELLNNSLEEANLYNHSLQLLHDDIRGFRHDFRNILQSISGYVYSNDMNGLRKYYKDIEKDCNHQNNISMLDPKLIKNPALYSLIVSKYNEAESLDIYFEVSFLTTLNSLNSMSYTISRILGILLDNAITAAKDSKEKKIILSTRKQTNKIVISIENSYSNKDVNLYKIREKGYTSKSYESGAHGLGLWEVNNILKKSDILNLYTDKNDDFFKQQLEIYNVS